MRFTIRTLLIVIVLAALVCLALRAPSIWWSGGMVAVFLATWLMSVLVAIYRSGQTRAMAIGFCVFSSVFLAAQGELWIIRIESMSLPMHELIHWSFDKLHRHEMTAGVANDSYGSSAMPAEDPFAPDSRAERFRAYKTICIASLAFVVGLLGATVAQILEKTRKAPPTPLNCPINP